MKEEICTLENMGPSWVRITSAWGRSPKATSNKEQCHIQYKSKYSVYDVIGKMFILRNVQRSQLVEFFEAVNMKPSSIDIYIRKAVNLKKRYKIIKE